MATAEAPELLDRVTPPVLLPTLEVTTVGLWKFLTLNPMREYERQLEFYAEQQEKPRRS